MTTTAPARRRNRPLRAATAEHRPATRRRRFRHDEIIAGDLFSGFGGLTRGMEMAGVTTILAANHNRYKVEVHEANHPDAEHFVCDLADPDAGDYHSPRDLPRVDWLGAGISCVHHSGANAQRAYAEARSLFTFDDPEWEERVTRSERDRATAVCVLQYAEIHHPRIILLECTTELTSWGLALPGKSRKIGDGTTYKWWLGQMHALGYRSKTLYLNSMFFGVPQSRDRIYLCFWSDELSEPNLEHRPIAHCERCDVFVESVWTWRTGIPPSGRVRWSEQYDYTCPSCSSVVVPPRAPAIQALDLSDLGTRIGDRPRPLAEASMERIRRCIDRFKDFPAVMMPAKAKFGVDRHAWQPLGTQTSQQETALVSTGIIPYRQHTIPTTYAEPMPTFTAEQIPGVLAAGVINVNGGIEEAKYRAHPVTDPFTGFTTIPGRYLLSAGFFKNNGGGMDTAPHPVTDPLGTQLSKLNTGLLVSDWERMLDGLTPEECFYRMMLPHEVRDGCGFDKEFIVWGSARDQVDGYGNAVSPPVGEWISLRLKEIL